MVLIAGMSTAIYSAPAIFIRLFALFITSVEIDVGECLFVIVSVALLAIFDAASVQVEIYAIILAA